MSKKIIYNIIFLLLVFTFFTDTIQASNILISSNENIIISKIENNNITKIRKDLGFKVMIYLTITFALFLSLYIRTWKKIKKIKAMLNKDR
jgi:hypothetical protein